MNKLPIHVSGELVDNLTGRTMFVLFSEFLLEYDKTNTKHFWFDLEGEVESRLQDKRLHISKLFTFNAPAAFRLILRIGSIKIYQDENLNAVYNTFNINQCNFRCIPYDTQVVVDSITRGTFSEDLAVGAINGSMILPSSWDYIINSATDELKEMLRVNAEGITLAAAIESDNIILKNVAYYPNVSNLKNHKGDDLFVDAKLLRLGVTKYINDVLDYYKMYYTKEDRLCVSYNIYGVDYFEEHILGDIEKTIDIICDTLYNRIILVKRRQPYEFEGLLGSALNSMRGI